MLKRRVVARWQTLDIACRSLEAERDEQGWALIAGVKRGASSMIALAPR